MASKLELEAQKGMMQLQASFYAGDKEKEDYELAMAPMELLGAGPVSVNILGNLCLISTGQDFPLNKDSDFKFQYLRTPSSFRASLSQVCSEGYWAFLEADTQMDKIRMLTDQIPGTMKSCLNILFNGTLEDVTDFLPIELSKINRISKTCQEASKTAVAKFSTVMHTMQEMHESTIVKEGLIDGQISQTKADLDLAERDASFFEQEENEAKEEKERIEEELKERTEEYKKAYDSMPDGMQLAGLALAETAMKVAPILAMAGAGSMILGAATGAETAAMATTVGVTSIGNQIRQGVSEYRKDSAPQNQGETASQVPLSSADKELYRYANNLRTNTAYFEAILRPTGGKGMNFKLASGEEDDGKSCAEIETAIKAILTRVDEQKEGASNKLHGEVIDCIATMTDLCSKLKNVNSQEEDETIAKEVKELRKISKGVDFKLGALEVEADVHSPGGSSMSRPGPGMKDKLLNMVQGMEEKSSLTSNVLETAQLKLSCAKEQMKSSEEIMKAARKTALQAQKKRAEMQNKIEKFNLTTKELPLILEVIQEGLKAMAELREEWSKLLRFFTKMGTMIEVAMGGPLIQFEEYSRQIGDRKMKSNQKELFSPSEVMKQQIYNITKEASKQAFLVNRLSGNYCQISTNHLMPLVSKLNKMIVMDKKDGAKIQTEKIALQEEAKEAQNEIKKMTEENFDNGLRALQRRRSELEEMEKKFIPALPYDTKLKIEEKAKEITQPSKIVSIDDF